MSEIALLIHNARLVSENIDARGWLAVGPDGDIARLGAGDAPSELIDSASEVLDAGGDMLLPGAIDGHVHFRDPGLTHKADIATESRAAVAGGVTSYIDMPNTAPQTTTMCDLEAKMARAAGVSVANYAFYLGATNSNLPELLAADYTRVAGVKLFLGSSTGNMLVDNPDSLREIFTRVPALIAVHAEHEATIAENRRRLVAELGDDIPVERHSDIRDRRACLISTRAAVSLARQTGARLHVLHVSTSDELSLFTPGPVAGKRVTAETCPQYLVFSRDDYASRGSRIKCNPAVKDAADRDTLRQALLDGVIDCVATDHAPHLLSEKQGNALTAVSGMPMIQFSLPLMLTLTLSTPLTPSTVVRLMAHNPAELYGVERRGFLRPGYRADLTLVRREDWTVTDADVLSRCRWTPLDGLSLGFRVVATWVNGRRAFPAPPSGAPCGEPLRFAPPRPHS